MFRRILAVIALLAWLPLSVPVLPALAAPASGSTSSDKSTVTPFEKRELVNPLGGSSASKAGTTDISAVVGQVVKVFTGIVGSLALLMFVYGSFLLMTSRGQSDQVERGKKTLLMAVVGLAIVFAAYAAINLLFTGLGVK